MTDGRKRAPHPVYWEYLYICIGVTAVCGAGLVALGRTFGGLLLLVAAAVGILTVRLYKARLRREDNAT